MNCVHKVNHFPTCNDITFHFFQCLITLLITSFCLFRTYLHIYTNADMTIPKQYCRAEKLF